MASCSGSPSKHISFTLGDCFIIISHIAQTWGFSKSILTDANDRRGWSWINESPNLRIPLELDFGMTWLNKPASMEALRNALWLDENVKRKWRLFFLKRFILVYCLYSSTALSTLNALSEESYIGLHWQVDDGTCKYRPVFQEEGLVL